jgi:hypothetical protein
MDIDMLRKGKADQTSLLALVKDCATLEVEADGLAFLANGAVAEEITKDSEYLGYRGGNPYNTPRPTAELILLDALREWARKLGFASYDTIAIRGEDTLLWS